MDICVNNMTKRIYRLGKQLGLNNKDIDKILRQTSSRNEQPSLTAGPDVYSGGWYGTISINDF